MCRFLLEHGADANHVAPPMLDGFKGWFVTAIQPLRNDFETEEGDLEPILECRKLLIQAGCDPSWKEDPLDEYIPSPLADMFRGGVPDAMRICFDYSGELLTPEVVVDIPYGHTPLLSYCHGLFCNMGPTIEGFNLLLNRGADLSTRDSQGDSCLHLCLMNVRSDASFGPSGAETAGQYLERVRLSFGYLIQHGAEVHAINDHGLSVSDISYEDNVRGHLWDVVLADCGLDVTKFRTVEYCWRPCRVKRRWGKTLAERYTKDDFMSLWKGKEHLCPYYEEVVRTGFDDSLYSDPESDYGEDNDDSDDSDDGDEGCYGDSGEDNDDNDEGCYDEQSGSDDGSDDESDGGCTLEGA